jgi:hypothetical protein
MSEPRIQIGDRVLTNAQAMALRVAVTTFHIETGSEEARQEIGPIADAYHARLGEVLTILITSPAHLEQQLPEAK